jgi:hypothetical protein
MTFTYRPEAYEAQVVNAIVHAGTVSSTAPANATATGTAGQIAFDATHLYVCIDTNTWVRCSLASW